MLTSAQITKARQLLGWTLTALSRKSGLDVSVVLQTQIDDGIRSMKPGDRDRIQRALEVAGVEFTNDKQPGAKLKADR